MIFIQSLKSFSIVKKKRMKTEEIQVIHYAEVAFLGKILINKSTIKKRRKLIAPKRVINEP
jgi:hypothetical protein